MQSELFDDGGYHRKMTAILRACSEVADGMAYLHARGVVHGHARTPLVGLRWQSRRGARGHGQACRRETDRHHCPGKNMSGDHLVDIPSLVRRCCCGLVGSK